MPHKATITLLLLRPARALLVLASLSVSVIVAAVVAIPADAQQTDVRSLQQRIERLESDLSILQRQIYTGGGGLPVSRPLGSSAASGASLASNSAADIEVRFSQIEDQMQSLTGRIEELSHSVDVLKSQLERLSKDVDFRLSALEKGGGARGAEGGPQATARPNADAGGEEPAPGQTKPVLGPGQVLPVGTSQQQYDYARALLIQQDYAGAEKAFSAFINTHPNDPLAGAAQYWLGETYYARGNYDQAAKTFAEGYQRYPKSPKAPDTLLKLGMSLVQLKRTKDACVLFNELNQRYPNAPTNVKQAAQRERQHAGCG